MECTICHQDKVPYEFAVMPPGKPLVCFDCNSPYPCCECGETYPSTHYRIQGRMCVGCRNARTGVITGKIARAYVRVLNNAPVAEIATKRDSGANPAVSTVVNFKAVKKLWNRDTRTWSQPNMVYVGRWNKTYQLPHSQWHNPFVMGAETEREGVIDLYRTYIKQQIADGYVNLEELRGKTLVCWCDPLPCHGHVLVELLGE